MTHSLLFQHCCHPVLPGRDDPIPTVREFFQDYFRSPSLYGCADSDVATEYLNGTLMHPKCILTTVAVVTVEHMYILSKLGYNSSLCRTYFVFFFPRPVALIHSVHCGMKALRCKQKELWLVTKRLVTLRHLWQSRSTSSNYAQKSWCHRLLRTPLTGLYNTRVLYYCAVIPVDPLTQFRFYWGEALHPKTAK